MSQEISSEQPKGPKRFMGRGTPLLICIVLIGVIIRVLWLACYPEDYGKLPVDPDGYAAIGRSVASGDGFRWPPEQAPTARRPAIYPLALSAIFAAGGGRTEGLSLTILSDAVTCVLIYLLAIKLRLRRNAALLAAQILGNKYPEIRETFKKDRERRRQEVIEGMDPRS